MPDRHAPTSGVGHRRSLTCLMEVRLVSVISFKWLPTCHAMSYEVGRWMSGRRRRGIGSSGAGCQTDVRMTQRGGALGFAQGPRCGFGHEPGPAGSLTCVHPDPAAYPGSTDAFRARAVLVMVRMKIVSPILTITWIPCTSELVPLLGVQGSSC